MRRVLSILASLLVGCASSESGDGPGDRDPDGKADGDGDAKCTQQYTEWMLTTFKRELTASPVTTERAAAIATVARARPCDGVELAPTAWTTWQDVVSLTAVSPYLTQHLKAYEAFHFRTSTQRGDYAAYLDNTRPSAELARTFEVLELVKPLVSVERLEMTSWLELVHVVCEETLSPLWDLWLQTHVEGNWILNRSEAQFLDLVLATRPTRSRAGAYAAWIEKYGEVLTHGFRIDPDDDHDPTDANGNPDREAVLDRLKALAPPANGDEDSLSWMVAHWLWATLVVSSSSSELRAGDQRQLSRIDAVRPGAPSGLAAYEQWLATVAETATDPIYRTSTLPAKPCVAPGKGDAAYTAFKADNAALPGPVVGEAVPMPCR